MMLEADRQDGQRRPGGTVLRKTWKFRTVQKDAQFKNKWRRIIKGATCPLTQVHVEKWPIKWCVCVCVQMWLMQ